MNTAAQSKDQTAIIDPNYFWQPMDTCPLGYKVQLLTVGGVATYGAASKHSNFLAWSPVPKMTPEIKEKVSKAYKE